jgi:c-di-GMP-binding flagellar brake protein YcgR
MPAQPGKAASPTTERRKRRHPRFRCSFPVVVTLLSGEGYRQLNAHCKDLSEAGIGMLIAAELTTGEVVSLNFSLPELSQPWDVRAVLRHRRGYHYGFEFLSLSPAMVEIIKNYLMGLERAD